MIKLKKVRYYCPACKDFVDLNVPRATKKRVSLDGHYPKIVTMRLAKVQPA